MKYLQLFFTLLLPLISFAANAQSDTLHIEFRTVDMGGFSHENHVLAVWIETEDTTFIKTPLVYAAERKSDLFTWNAAAAYGNEIDAMTGATQEYHKTYQVKWDCKDTSRVEVPNGNYVLHIEMNNNHSQSPLAEIPFILNGEEFSLTPDDETYFKDIKLDFLKSTATGVAIKVNSENDILIYPNCVDNLIHFKSVTDENINSVEFYNISGELIQRAEINSPSGEVNLSSLSPGTYLVRVHSSKGIESKKFIKR